MRTDALLLVLAAAAIHATWNALTKRAQDQLAFLWSSVSLATLVLLPAGWALLPPEGVPGAAWPFLVATSVIHAVYFYVLGRAYAKAGNTANAIAEQNMKRLVYVLWSLGTPVLCFGSSAIEHSETALYQ